MFNRRDFIKKAGLAAGMIPLMELPMQAWENEHVDQPLSIHLFSKHLQFLDVQSAADAAAEMGFAGLDLTVRPKGHVLPESVKDALPKAMVDIKAGGSSCKMITTAVTSVDNPIDVDVLETASAQGVKYYRMNWLKYSSEEPMIDSLDKYRRQVAELSQFNEDLGLVGCYQNHAGKKVGASYWEIHKLLETADPETFGAQYDIRHAVVEGGYSWENGFRLLQPHIKTIVLKDSKWGKSGGKWKSQYAPIGEGMVDFDAYFKLLKKHKLRPPVSLHLEYPLGGAEKGRSSITVDKKVVFEAMKKDLKTINRFWEEA